jgi:hypothetical protein
MRRPVTILPPVRTRRPPRRGWLSAALHARVVTRAAADVLGFILFVVVLGVALASAFLPEDVLIDLFHLSR